MHILHGTWLSEFKEFAFWGEDIGAEPTKRKGKRGKTAPHPFQLSVENLLRYLDRFSPDSLPDGGKESIWLPGNGKNVQPSPEAQEAGMPALEDELSLLAWELDMVLLLPNDFLDLMLQLPSEPRGFTLGSDLKYWQQVALLLMNCLVEGRYVPTIEQRGSQFLARWQVRADVDLVGQLEDNMPTLCRAMVEDVDLAPQPSALLKNCMDATIDYFVRDYIGGKSFRYNHPLVRALTSLDFVIAGTGTQNRKLYQAWTQWQALEETASGGTFRICFRLDEPQNDKEQWALSYLLQAADDPSLLVEAETVWASKGQQMAYLEYRFDNAQEKLLAALGFASRIFKPIEDSLRSATPTGIMLDISQAYQFLTDAAATLEASGFSVLVPNWWRKRAQIKAKVKMKGQANEPTGFLTRDALVKYQWQLSLGGETLTQDEFEQLVALKQPMVRYRGEWVTLDPAQIQEMTEFFKKSEASEGEIPLLDAFKMAMDGADQTPEGVEIESTDVEGWLLELFEQMQNPDVASVPPIPDSLRATLRPYQERGYGWLAQMYGMGLGACLADDMGLGKTLQTIAYWLDGFEQGEIERPALLVCPTSVVGNWAHEISRFAPTMTFMKHQGPDRLKDEEFAKAAERTQVVLTSYALMQRDIETLNLVEWSSVVLDEAQNIKNPSTKQAQAARSITADHRIALTGTPVENRLSELWSIFQFLNRGYLGSQKAFRSNFSIPIERYGEKEAAVALKKLTTPFILRRVKTDPNVIQDLPDKFENKVYCSLTPEQATLYEATVREEMEEIETAEGDMQRRGNVLRMLTRLKQICNHPAHFLKENTASPLVDRSGKLTRMVELLEEVREVDERALIFTQYAEMGHLLQPYLKEHFVDEVLFLHGGTPSTKREDMVRSFQSKNGPPLFLLSLKAGGTGLNLTHANHVFHFDRWYNPAVENQATDRAFRIGQTKNVQVHKFVCLGTLEERIDELIEHKQALADQIIGEGESWLSELSNTELHDLVMLRRDVVEG